MGTAPLGGLYEDTSEDVAVATIHHAFTCGITLFDTAPHYGAGLAEQRLGQALKTIPRDEITLATKVGRLVTADGRTIFDFSRDGILRSLDESLARLQTDRIDIVHIHDPDEHVSEAMNVAFPTLAELRDQRVIGAIGVGMNQWQVPLAFVRETAIDCLLLAGRYTLLEQNGALDELLPACEQAGVQVILGGVYNSGILATGSIPNAHYNYRLAPPAVRDRVLAMEGAGRRHGVSLRAAALQFPLAHPAVHALVIGMRSPAEADDLRQGLQEIIPTNYWEELRELGLISSSAPVPT